MQVRAIQPHELEPVRRLLLGAGWERQVATPEEFALLVAQSQLSLVAVREGEVVGYLRALTDGLTNGYISMVVVHPAYQRRGIGRALVAAAMGNNERMTWVLRAGRADGVATFYEKLGFSRSSVAMERPGKFKSPAGGELSSFGAIPAASRERALTLHWSGTSTGMALGPRSARCHHPLRGPSAIPAPAPQLKRYAS